MKRLAVVLAATLVLSISFCDIALAGMGTIGGQLLFNEWPIGGVTINFFDSVNGELASAPATSNESGAFSYELEPGYYKIHFSLPSEKACFDEFYNAKGDGENVFDLGTAVPVLEGQVTDLGMVRVFSNDKPRYCGPMECIPVAGRLRVVVYDTTKFKGGEVGVGGIRVQFKDPETAFPKFGGTKHITDENGVVEIAESGCSQLDAKIRFSDPYGRYSAEYYGTTDLDDFSAGETVDFTKVAVTVVDGIGMIPPAEQVGEIIEDVLAVLPPDEAQPIVSSLEQGQALLQDANPNNDKGACGTLLGSANKLNGLIASGRVSPADADALAAAISALKNDLACRD